MHIYMYIHLKLIIAIQIILVGEINFRYPESCRRRQQSPEQLSKRQTINPSPEEEREHTHTYLERACQEKEDEKRGSVKSNISSPMFITMLFTIAKIWKQPKFPSVDESIKKLWCIYNGILLSCKKRGKSHPLQQHGWSWVALCEVK